MGIRKPLFLFISLVLLVVTYTGVIFAQGGNTLDSVSLTSHTCSGTAQLDVTFTLASGDPLLLYTYSQTSPYVNSISYNAGVNYGTGTHSMSHPYSAPGGAQAGDAITVHVQLRLGSTIYDEVVLTFICDTGVMTSDTDRDYIEDSADNCPANANHNQADSDGDGLGDVCDTTPTGDIDADGIDNGVDNCPGVANPGQEDLDGDGLGDACDNIDNTDIDGDGIKNINDDCPLLGDIGFGVQNNGCPPHIVLPPDDRINWQYGDLHAVLYRHPDGVVAYCYDGNTWLGMLVTQETVDNADLTQAQDVPVQEYGEFGCHISFYILDSGEYQINIWNNEGKFYEIIADNIHFDDVAMRYYDPNE